MGALVPLLLFAVEAVLIYIVGNVLLAAAAIGGPAGGKMLAVWTALGIGVVISVLVFLASRGGSPQPTASRGGGRH